MSKYGPVERVQVVIDAKVGPGISDSALWPSTPRVGKHDRIKLWHELGQFWEDIAAVKNEMFDNIFAKYLQA